MADILVFTNSDPSGLLAGTHMKALPVAELRKSLDDFVASLKDTLPAEATIGQGFGLKSLTVAVGINGKGQVGFLGTGAELGGTATLTLNFERS